MQALSFGPSLPSDKAHLDTPAEEDLRRLVPHAQRGAPPNGMILGVPYCKLWYILRVPDYKYGIIYPNTLF